MTFPTVAELRTVDDVVTQLERLGRRVRRRGREWQAQCPAHDDNTESLSISAGDQVPYLVHCHAGCDFNDVLDVLQGRRAPFPLSGHSSRKRRRAGPAEPSRVVARYHYENEIGQRLYTKLRLEPKSFRFERADGRPGLPDGQRRVLYRLPELAAAPAGALVFIVEGEKDADRLASLGLVATCTDTGAGKWPAEFNGYFQDLIAVVIPDNDQAGREHARLVAENVATTAQQARILELPELPDKGDVSDWLHAGHGPEELLSLCLAAPLWEEIDAADVCTQTLPERTFQEALDTVAMARYRAIKSGAVIYRREEEELPRPAKKASYSHLSGDYDAPSTAHQCKAYWRAPVLEDGTVEGVYKVRYEAWRTVSLKNGGTLHCPACWHERVLDFCKEIERVSLNYREWETLRYYTVPSGKYRREASKIRKYNQRARESGAAEVNYTSFPTRGSTVILHDAPDYLGGETLPGERPQLFSLVTRWADTPKGKRAGRGFSSWNSDKSSKGKKSRKDDAKAGKATIGYFYGGRYMMAALLASRYLDIHPHGKATKTPGLKATEFASLMEAAGCEYGVEGEIPGVTDKTRDSGNTTLKRDIPRAAEHPLGLFERARAAPVPEPAPIYL